MHFRLGLALLAAASLAACGQGRAGDNTSTSSSATAKFKPIDGFNDLKLGASFEDVIGGLDTAMFSGSLAECVPELPVKGCRLYAAHDSVYTIRGAIPYFLNLAFNRLGHLTDIGLNYRREGDVTGAQCLDIFSRTIDWVTADFGPMNERKQAVDLKDKYISAKTPGGTSYSYLKPSNDGGFVTRFMRVASLKEASRKINGEEHFYALNRNLYVFAAYIVVDGKPSCMVNVDFGEPEKVERPGWSTDEPVGD